MIAVESKIILSFFAEKGPYNMTVRSVVPLIVTDTKAYMKYLGHMKRIYAYLRFFSYAVHARWHRQPVEQGHYYGRLTLISAWIRKHTHYQVWGEIIYPFIGSSVTVEV